jgi:hypothetical protein
MDVFARASCRRKRDEGPGWDQNECGSGRVGSVGAAIVVLVVAVLESVGSAMSCLQNSKGVSIMNE